MRFLVAKPGLDGHSNGAEQIASRARDCGMEMHYAGIRQTPAEIAAAARDTGADVIGLSILSGSHMALVADVLDRLAEMGLRIPVTVGGIIPAADADHLRSLGVAAVYTPKDFEMNRIMLDLADLVAVPREAAE
jgi:(2R)-ethylmalonyl-CoA mutase